MFHVFQTQTEDHRKQTTKDCLCNCHTGVISDERGVFFVSLTGNGLLHRCSTTGRCLVCVDCLMDEGGRGWWAWCVCAQEEVHC